MDGISRRHDSALVTSFTLQPTGYAASSPIASYMSTASHLLCVLLVSFPGSPSPFLNFTRANIIREKSKERESLVRNPAHPWLLNLAMGSMERRAHVAIKTMARWPWVGGVLYHALSLLRFFTYNIRACKIEKRRGRAWE